MGIFLHCFGMPLHANEEIKRRVFDTFDKAVVGRRRHDQAPAHRFDALMVGAVDAQTPRATKPCEAGVADDIDVVAGLILRRCLAVVDGR